MVLGFSAFPKMAIRGLASALKVFKLRALGGSWVQGISGLSGALRYQNLVSLRPYNPGSFQFLGLGHPKHYIATY